MRFRIRFGTSTEPANPRPQQWLAIPNSRGEENICIRWSQLVCCQCHKQLGLDRGQTDQLREERKMAARDWAREAERAVHVLAHTREVKLTRREHALLKSMLHPQALNASVWALLLNFINSTIVYEDCLNPIW